MTPREVLDFYGTKYRFNKETGMSCANLLNWERKGKIPYAAQLKIQILSNEKLKADEAFYKDVAEKQKIIKYKKYKKIFDEGYNQALIDYKITPHDKIMT